MFKHASEHASDLHPGHGRNRVILYRPGTNRRRSPDALEVILPLDTEYSQTCFTSMLHEACGMLHQHASRSMRHASEACYLKVCLPAGAMPFSPEPTPGAPQISSTLPSQPALEAQSAMDESEPGDDLSSQTIPAPEAEPPKPSLLSTQ